MPKFQNGEIAILCGLEKHEAHLNGEEIVVMRYLGMEEFIEGVFPAYEIEASFFSKNTCVGVVEARLKKKKPPEEDIDWVEKLNLKVPNKETENA